MKVLERQIKFNKKIILLLFPLSVILVYFSSKLPSITEKIYSNGVYKFISQILSNITGIVPFSIGEVGLIIIVIICTWWLIKNIIMILKIKNNIVKKLLKLSYRVIIAVIIVYFIFNFIWGLNYYRLPFSDIARIDIKEASTDELAELCEYLIEQGNTLRTKVNENNAGVMYLPNGHKDIFNRSYLGYNNASAIYPELRGRYGKPKGVIFSEVMSYMGISGIYSPFTAEANVNISIPDSMIPSTTCHEMAHQYGFAREDEANYIAYLTCSMHPDVDFQYSGNLLAIIYSMNALYKYDAHRYWMLYENYSDGIKNDLKNISAYWSHYEGPIEKASDKLNDTYLKINRQQDGVRSYGRMVDLLLAEFLKNKTQKRK